jgi:hypothetical protein
MRRRLVVAAVVLGAAGGAGAWAAGPLGGGHGDGLTPAQQKARAQLVREANDPQLKGLACGCRHRWPATRPLPLPAPQR